MAKISTSEGAQSSSQRTINLQSRKTKKICDFLVRVALGEEFEEVPTKEKLPDGTFKLVKKTAPLNVRVQAAKTYKELVVDKILPDKKHDPKKKDREGDSLVKALEQVALEKQAELAGRN